MLIRVNKIIRLKPTFILLFYFSISSLYSLAADEVQKKELSKTQLVNNAIMVVRDDKFDQPEAGNRKDFTIDNYIQFRIDPNVKTYYQSTPFTATLQIKIKQYQSLPNDTNAIAREFDETLVIYYDTAKNKPYQGEAFRKFKGAGKYTVQVLSITTSSGGAVPPIFDLIASTSVKRKYNFVTTPGANAKISKIISAGKVDLEWGTGLTDFPGAELYDLEYTFLHDLDARAGLLRFYVTNNSSNGAEEVLYESVFAEGATRITLPNTKYTINNVYEKGILIYRVRSVQYPNEYDDNITNPYEKNFRKQSNWLYKGDNSSQVSNLVELTAHEPNLNWQYSGTFAEDGKRKEVMAYFDGTGRNRQNVTINNADNQSVVQETIYDEMGRAAVNVLPAPTAQGILKYFQNFNISQTSGLPYSHNDFVAGLTNCRVNVNAMSNSSGAAMYYSSSNNLGADLVTKYTANAGGFPFTVTEFMPDNTGRVLTQGGVGANFQPQSGHETKYFYGKPSQESLNRLFGPEVGNASHYLKNMVQDANGQLSVSYINASGKTIATALAGAKPNNLEALASNSQPAATIEQLIKQEDFAYNSIDKSLTASATFLVTAASKPNIVYTFQPQQLAVSVGSPINPGVCYTCKYSVQIKVTDFCNTTVYSETKVLGDLNTTCAIYVLTPSSIALQNGSNDLAPGQYSVSFTLLIDEAALDYYDNHNFTTNPTIKQLNFFVLEQLMRTDFAACFSNCNSCKELSAMGLTGFIAYFQSLYATEGLVFDAAETNYITQLYNQLTANCASLQCPEPTNPCENKLLILLPDVRPGGQYALYDTTSFELLEPAINILAKRNLVNWVDDNGNPILVANSLNQMVSPADLTMAEFIQYFDDAWARKLVVYHPEYCYYLFCIANSASAQFDDNLISTDDAALAKSNGWFGNATTNVTNTWLLDIDPFFNNGGAGAAYKTELANLLNNFSATQKEYSSNVPIKGITGFIDYELYCQGPDASAPLTPWNSSCIVAADCRSPYMEWKFYRNYYLELKARYEEKVRSEAGCTSCGIGATNITPATGTTITINNNCPQPSHYIAEAFCDNNLTPYLNNVSVWVNRLDNQPLDCVATVQVHITGRYYQFGPEVEFGTVTIEIPAGFTSYSEAFSFSNLLMTAWGEPICPYEFIDTVVNVSYTCPCSSIILPSPGGNCTPDPLYANKERRMVGFLNGDGITPSNAPTGPGEATVLAELRTARIDAIIDELKTNCNITGALNGETALRTRLNDILSVTLTSNNMLGASSKPDGSDNFIAAYTAKVGSIGSVDCSPYLVGMFYPHDKQPLLEKRNLIQVDNTICNRITTLLANWGGSNTNYAGFHAYLLATYPTQYTLTQAELQDFVQACNQCTASKYLEEPRAVPIIFENTALALTRGDFNTHVANFHTIHGINSGNLATEKTKHNYTVAFTNYLNYQTGFGLDYTDYETFANNSDAYLYNKQIVPDAPDTRFTCLQDMFTQAAASAKNTYTIYADSVHRAFRNAYMQVCAASRPEVKLESIQHEYHYTIYYYDQSGNLVKTVPPQGVQTNGTATTLPNHDLVTQYQYNSLNQVTWQNTPDAGASRFWYDVLGRLVVSQNAEQQTPQNGGPTNRYSYTKYDNLGRIYEVGEKVNGTIITSIDIKDNAALATWHNSGTNTQVTETYYDAPVISSLIPAEITSMQGTLGNNRKRVVSTLLKPVQGMAPTAGTHYAYDLAGNVKMLWQQVKALYDLDNSTQGIKKINYEYDLISGKVNRVIYQQGKGDQFYYQYKYDAENRLTEAATSRDALTWQTDATYYYYKHGPLARVETGHSQNQGTDYAYTLQGWLKYINGPLLNSAADIGMDGFKNNTDSLRSHFSKDAMAYGLYYYQNDYTAIANSALNTYSVGFNLSGTNTGKDLYNGNISKTTVALQGIGNGGTTGYTYQYDQLNRLIATRQHGFSTATGSYNAAWTVQSNSFINDYAETISYDANGNILSLQRNGHTQNGSPLAMDNLGYNYTAGTNKLRQVTDAVPNGNYTEDIDNQTDADNYVYDAIGNLINDKAEKINKINWTVYGKIGNIQKHNAFIGYGYDAGGNRVVKQYNKFTTNLCADCPPGSATDNLVVYERKNNQPTTYTARTSITFEEGYIDGTNDEYEAEINDALAVCTPDCNQSPPLLNSNVDIYIRDAQGNVMAMYSYAPAVGSTAASFKWTEQHLYGSSRIGIFKWDSIVPLQPPVVLSSNAIVTDIYKTGSKFFELTNHLQNVLVTYSDKKVQVANGSNVDYFLADVVIANDYYPFGMTMPGRSYSASSSKYRYGFNGQEKSNDVTEGNYTAEYWEYDSRIGRRWNTDPIVKDDESPYMTMGNNPIACLDPDGADWYHKNGDKNKDNLTWFDGSGKQKGFSRDKRGTGFWTDRNKNNISVWYGNSKDDIQMVGADLAEVTVVSDKKAKKRNTLADRAFGWANFDKAEAKKWQNNLWDYQSLRNQGVSAEDAGAKYGGLGATYERYHQAEQDWRAANIAILEFGTLFVPVPKVGMTRWLFGSKYGRVLWTGGGAGGVANKAAVKFAAENFGTTLGQTNAGKIIIKLTGNTQNWLTGKIWDYASWAYARGAKGSVDVFIHLNANTNVNQVYWRIEKPVLDRLGINIFEHYR